MVLPTQEALLRAYPGDVWGQAAVIDTHIEAVLVKMVPVGGRIACAQYTVERTEGGMHLEEAIGDRAHVDIDVDTNEDQKEIRGVAVPTSPIDPSIIKSRKINFELPGEVVRDKLRMCADALGGLSGVTVIAPRTQLRI